MPNGMKRLGDVADYENEGQPTLHNPKITVSFWGDILDGFNGEWTYADAFKEKLAIGNLNLIDLDSKFFVLEFQTEGERNSSMTLLEEKIEMKNTFMSKELEHGRQIPGVDGYFERDGKFYLILHSYLRNTDETDVDKGIYKGNIVNLKAYYEGDEVIGGITDSFESEVEDNIREK